MRRSFITSVLVCAILPIFVLSACSLEPKEAKSERKVAQAVGDERQWTKPFAKRDLPELPASPAWTDVLRRAFYANGELETAYWEWRAALERVRMAGSYPNSNIEVGFDYMFSKENLKSWDRTTISAGFDPSMPLQWPGKVAKAAEIEWKKAQAAGLKLAAAKFDLQKKVLTAWWDYAAMAERTRIARENVQLLQALVELTDTRVRVGQAGQQDLTKAQMQVRLAHNEIANMESELKTMRAMLNAMLARSAEAALNPPAKLPDMRIVEATDDHLIAAGVSANPELAGLAREVAGRRDAIELARMKYIPDFNISGSWTGNMSQAVGAMVMLPTQFPMIEGQIKETKAMFAASEAMLRQNRYDKGAAYIAALYSMRNAQRAEKNYRELILPTAEESLRASREAYRAGRVGFVDLVDSQRTLLEVRMLLADLRASREKRLAELEALGGVDMERVINQNHSKGPTP